MRRPKERLTVTVDRALVEAGHEAVRAGRADSLSGWVNLALLERAAKERRLRALSAAVEAYEKKHGIISPDELSAQAKADRRSAIVVRGTRSSRPSRRRRTGSR